jgi:hypothetical protein
MVPPIRKRAIHEGCDSETWVKHRQPSLMVLPTMLGELLTGCPKDRFAFTPGKPKVE